MADILVNAVIVVVVVLLAVGLARQFATSGPRWLLLDQLGIVPQWKFFGQVQIASNPAWADDLHLLARSSPGGQAPGDWQELLFCDERRLGAALWNPHARSRAALFEHMAQLTDWGNRSDDALPPTALAYLTILCFCLRQISLGSDGTVQFAIATTSGRGERPLQLRFLSGWHGV